MSTDDGEPPTSTLQAAAVGRIRELKLMAPECCGFYLISNRVIRCRGRADCDTAANSRTRASARNDDGDSAGVGYVVAADLRAQHVGRDKCRRSHSAPFHWTTDDAVNPCPIAVRKNAESALRPDVSRRDAGNDKCGGL